MIDPKLDVLVWIAVLAFLVLMGARAWSVETAGARHYRSSTRTRVLTVATGLSLAALAGLVAMQGGLVFVEAVATRADPETLVTIVGDPADPGIGDQAPGTPGAPVDPNAPPAGANPPADPNAPAGQNPPPAGQNAPADQAPPGNQNGAGAGANGQRGGQQGGAGAGAGGATPGN